MRPVVEFPDVVAAVIGWLNTNLTPPVSRAIPNPRPAEFVTVVRTGGVRTSPVTEDAQITVEAWAATHPDAATLARRARALIDSLNGTTVAGVTVYQVSDVSGPQDLPDPDSEQPRNTFTMLIQVRGAPFAA